ncbi:MAG: hypothetical protein AAF974_03030 [Cyanobacteria bacterium P01_E01_bin.34]
MMIEIRKTVKTIFQRIEEATLYSNLNPSMFDTLIPEQYRGSNRDYQKFIVISHHRSASSLIINTLQRHPNVFRFSEIFLPNNVQLQKPEYVEGSKRLLYLRKQYPVEFLERFIFTGYQDSVHAMGFKLFPEQLEFPYMAPVWDWIEANTDIKIIFLTREDLLAYYTSFVLALKTKLWGVATPKQLAKAEKERQKNPTVRLEYDKCLAAFEKRKRLNDYALDRCKNHDILKVSFEDVTSDLNRSLLRSQEFLGLEPQELKVRTKRQQVRPMSDVISNYQELKEQFASTEWSYLFA